MGQTFGNFAVSLFLLLIPALVTAETDPILLTGVTLRKTTGTLQQQFILADRATLEEATGIVDVEALELQVDQANDMKLNATADRGDVVIAGKAPGAPLILQDLREIRRYARNFESEAANGDLILRGDERHSTADIETIGSLESEIIIWSKKYRRVFLPAPFTQRADAENGSLEINGAALSVDHDFQNWTYYADNQTSGNLTFTVKGKK